MMSLDFAPNLGQAPMSPIASSSPAVMSITFVTLCFQPFSLLTRSRAQPQRSETKTGKAMQRELLKIALEEAVSRAWRDACDAEPTLTL